jgi:hypothetical protein
MALNRRVIWGTTFWVVVAVSGGILFARHWNEILVDETFVLGQQWIAAAVLALAVLHPLLALAWTLTLRALGGTIRASAATDAYILALLPKYLPGRIFGHGVRIHRAKMAGVPIGVATSAVLVEGVFAVASAVGIAAMGYALGALQRTETNRSILLITVGIAAVVGIAAFRGAIPGKRWKELSGISQISRHRLRFTLCLMLYVLSWLVFGMVNWLVANAIVPVAGNLWFEVTVAGAVASGIGFLAVFAPAGIGVREGLFYIFALDWMSSPDALVFVALCRLTSLTAEIAITATWVLFLRGRFVTARLR